MSTEAGAGEGGYVHELFRAAAEARPEAVAVTDDRGRWTYEDLDLMAGRLRGWLAERGVGYGDRVLAALPAGACLIALWNACCRSGAILVPISPTARPYQLRAILAEVEPRLTVVPAELADSVPDPVLPEELLDLPGPVPDLRSDPHPTALLMFTSGSSAVPKGVVCPHRAVLFAAQAIARRLEYREDDVVYCLIPLSFDYGLYQAILSAMAGCELVVEPPPPPAGLLDRLAAHRATVVPLVPRQAEVLAWFASRREAPPTVRLFTFTGAPMAVRTLDALRRGFPSAAVSVMYGLTECKRISMTRPGSGQEWDGSAGTAVDGTEIAVLVDGRRSSVPGRTGEIVVAGPHLMDGYWRRPDLTERRFRRDPETGTRWLHTGDEGFFDEGGGLHILGRLDATFSHHGVRISAEEIEAAAMDVPGVRGAALLPPAADRDPMVLFAVSELPTAHILRELRDRVGAERTPQECHVVAELPLNERGKLDRRTLRGLLRGLLNC